MVACLLSGRTRAYPKIVYFIDMLNMPVNIELKE